MKKLVICLSLIFFCVFCNNIVLAQEGIKLSTSLADSEIPMNRTVELIIKLEWDGDATKYEIEPFDNPPLTNLQIVGSSSSNRSGESDGKKYSVKTFNFTL